VRVASRTSVPHLLPDWISGLIAPEKFGATEAVISMESPQINWSSARRVDQDSRFPTDAEAAALPCAATATVR